MWSVNVMIKLSGRIKRHGDCYTWEDI